MIDSLSGKLTHKNPTHVIIQTGGIGFQILISLNSFDKLPETGAEIQLHTLLAVREDSLTLFGFVHQEERKIFEQLTQVSGIGPKLALTILSGLQLNDLAVAIRQGDVKRLSSISGIGKKTAERMVVELRDKLESTGPVEIQNLQANLDGPTRDAILALVALGYKQQDAAKLVQKAQSKTGDKNLDVESIVRLALGSK